MKKILPFPALNSYLRATAFSAAALLAIASGVTLAGPVAINYDYAQNHGVDFSNTKGAFRVGDFKDGRDVEDPHLLTTAAGGYTSEQTLSAVVRDAIIQAFEDGGAKLASSDEQLLLSGEITEFAVEEKGSGIETVLRVHVVLTKSGNTLWQNTLFGKASAESYESLDQAVRGSLDQLIEGLVWDDYFLMHVI